MSADLRPLHSRGLRDRLRAPELARYLGQRDTDLGAMDQVQAVRVRLERGARVLEERLAVCLEIARRWHRNAGLALATIALLAALSVALIEPPLGRGLALSLLAGAGVYVLRWRFLLRDDLGSLEALERRRHGLLEGEPSREELIAGARELFGEVEARTRGYELSAD